MFHPGALRQFLQFVLVFGGALQDVTSHPLGLLRSVQLFQQNLGLLTTSQTNDPEALVRVAVFLGLSPDFYRNHGWSLHALNVGKAGRHSKQILCRANFTSIRQQLKQIFHEEYGQLARLLDTFQLVDGSAESMVAAREWSCEEMKGRLGLLEVGRQ